jgi:hypothetical protein
LEDAATFGDVGSEGHFIIHVMQYGLQFLPKQGALDEEIP